MVLSNISPLFDDDLRLDYISVVYFKTSEEAHYYMNNALDKTLFKDSWIYEVD